MSDYIMFFEKERDYILNNWDVIVGKAINKEMQSLSNRLENDSDKFSKLNIVKRFFNDKESNELRKYALEGFFNALNMSIESNDFCFLHKQMPIVIIDAQDKNREDCLKISEYYSEELSKEMINIISENILYFPFHYDVLNNIRKTFSNSRYYELESIFENCDFSKYESSFLIKSIGELYPDDIFSKATQILEQTDKKRRPVDSNTNNQIYIESSVENKFELISDDEKIQIINLLYGEKKYAEKYFDNKNQEISDIFGKRNNSRLIFKIFDFLKNNNDVLDKLLPEVILSMINYNIEYLSTSMFDVRFDKARQMVHTEGNIDEKFLTKLGDIFVKNYELKKEELHLKIKDSIEYKGKIRLFMDDLVEKYKIKKGLRINTDGVHIAEDDGLLFIRLPENYYAYINSKKSIEFSKMFLIHTDSGFVIKESIKNTLNINILLETKLFISNEELMSKVVEYLNRNMDYVLEDGLLEKNKQNNMFDEFVREVNLLNKLAEMKSDQKIVNKKKI